MREFVSVNARHTSTPCPSAMTWIRCVCLKQYLQILLSRIGRLPSKKICTHFKYASRRVVQILCARTREWDMSCINHWRVIHTVIHTHTHTHNNIVMPYIVECQGRYMGVCVCVCARVGVSYHPPAPTRRNESRHVSISSSCTTLCQNTLVCVCVRVRVVNTLCTVTHLQEWVWHRT